ncbi:MAG TPA: trypsin-like peptidase domain-containing protein, partial [Thermoleophilia bacterium]|nr:trypsin-like peptidase domain-containing protein [Thermoleophilia bacterium]
MLLVLVVVVAVGASDLVRFVTSSTTAAAVNPGSADRTPLAVRQAGGSSRPLSMAAIERRVDPGLVDIDVTFDNANGGAATGMVLTPSGVVLTNNHVIAGATKITATDIGDGKTYRASVVGYARSRDVAVIQLIGASGLRTVPLG